MKKIVFFTQNNWAFGNIHNGLEKVLYKYGIFSNILDWTVPYPIGMMSMLLKTTDLFMTTPDAVGALHSYNIPYEKMLIVAHGEWDILRAKELLGDFIFDKTRNYGVVSKFLKDKSFEHGVEKIPEVLPLGVFTDYYFSHIRTDLKTIGYAGAFARENWRGVEIKRGNLALEVAKKTNTYFLKHEFYHWLSMPSYYKMADCVFVTSLEEGASLPLLEGGASGCVIFTTPTGYAYEKENKFNYVLPFNSIDLVKMAVEKINILKNDSKLMKEESEKIYTFIRENFDWSVCGERWAKFIIDSIDK